MTFLLKFFAALFVVVACEPAAVPIGGALFVTSAPSGANVVVDDRPRGQTPLTVRDLEAGDHEIVLQLDGYEDTQVIATVKPRQIVNVGGTLRPARRIVGHRLAFVSNRDGAYDIWTANEFGGDMARWTSGRWERSPLLALASVAGTHFAINMEDSRGLRTWLISAPRPEHLANGEPEMRLLSGDVFRILQWSPDSRSLLLKNLVSQTIWLAGTNGTIAQVRIPDAPRGVLSAGFAPDNTGIVYADTDRTYLIGLDGLRRQELTENGREGNTYLRYSRDGRRMVYVRLQKPNVYNAGELWLLSDFGRDARRLTLGGSQDFDPVWTRDGRHIVYVRRENTDNPRADTDPAALVSNLWVIDLQNQMQRPLTAFKGKRVRHPSISFEDQRITFICSETGADEVWMTDFVGGDPYLLTQDRATASFPMWLW